jgi:hypothetical protein
VKNSALDHPLVARDLHSRKALTVSSRSKNQERQCSKPILRFHRSQHRGGFMKKQLFALFGLGLLLATASAYGQTTNLKANVPFNFVVDGRMLPSGEYTIQSLNGVDEALTISGSGQKPSIFLANTCRSLKVSDHSKLVFHRYGDRYFLSEMWVEGNSSGRQLPISRREVQVAQNETAQQVVVLAELR